MPIPRGYKRKRLVKSYKRSCAPGSVRTVKRGRVRILICCPRGKWKPRVQRCKVGTRAVSIDKPKRLGSLATEARKERREHPWTTPAQARRIALDHRKRRR